MTELRQPAATLCKVDRACQLYILERNLSDAPDFRSPMFESAARKQLNLSLEKGPAVTSAIALR